ncbi:MAG: hypothetical protein QOI62_1519 [Solirubrobacteraceae bacterium]|nr:hypothetical protein [Solirubrobacteraceae bacterium]
MTPIYDRPIALASHGAVLLRACESWRPGRPVILSADEARELAGELLAAALTAQFGSPSEN